MKRIQLTQGKEALVDDEDYDELVQHKWCASKGGNGYYAVRGVAVAQGKRSLVKMHRALLSDVVQVDHIDGNGLNNQRSNLRAVNHSLNQANQRKHAHATSRFKGVSWDKDRKKWFVKVSIQYKQKFLGYFSDELAAAEAYDEAAVAAFGAFAKTNLPAMEVNA